jgi:hypothetical protein
MEQTQITSTQKFRDHFDIHSFISLAHAEWDNSLPFSGASSIALSYILFPAILLHLHHFILPSVTRSTSWSC